MVFPLRSRILFNRHRVLAYSVSFLSSVGLFACASVSQPPSPELTVDNSASTLTAPASSNIKTQAFNPTKIEVTLNRLPQPYTTKSVAKPPQILPVPTLPQLKVPAGFSVNVFAEGLDAPRWLALTPTGEVLVTETRQNRIRILADRDNNGVADFNQVFASANNGLNIPFGMAFADGYFFLGNTAEVRRYHYAKTQQQLIGTGEKIADLPGGGYNQHWTRNVIADAKGDKLYVSIGSESNASEEPLPRASVQVMNLDGSNRQTLASGLRNPVGLAVHPETGELYTTVNERDGLGDDLVPDYFTRIRQGEFYGWPYAYLTPSLLDPRHVNQNGRSDNPDQVAQTRTPDVLFQAHSAPLGLQFYDGRRFPEKYHNGAFVAFRGSWNRDRGTGYKIVFIPFSEQENRPLGYYEDFVTGFLSNPSVPTAWGRPVGLLVLPDGSLLFTDEANGRIYRVAYTAPPLRKAPPTVPPPRD